MKSTKRRVDSAGSSLLEALVSLSLLAILTAAVGTFLTGHVRRSAWTYQRTYAYSLAQQELEEMRALDYDNLVSRAKTVPSGSATYTVSTTVVPNSPAPQLKTVSVTVSWTDQRGPQSITVATAYAQVRR